MAGFPCSTCGSTDRYGFEEMRTENLDEIVIVSAYACNECGSEEWYKEVYTLTQRVMLTPEERQKIIEERRE